MKILHSVPIALIISALAGCAGGPSQQTAADLTRAHTLVAAAEQSGAQQYAAGELQSARDKAQQADQLADHDADRADQFANEASADAQLASARTQNAKAQRAVEDQRRSLLMLGREAQQDANSRAEALPSSAGPQTGAPIGAPTGPGDTTNPSN